MRPLTMDCVYSRVVRGRRGYNCCRSSSSGLRWIVICCVVIVHLLSATAVDSAAVPSRRTSPTRRRHAERALDAASSATTSTTTTTTTSVRSNQDEGDADDDCAPSLPASADYSGGSSNDESTEDTVSNGDNADENSLERCLSRGREFLSVFLKSIRKQHLQFDKCNQYRLSVTCLRAHLGVARPCRSRRASRQLHHHHHQQQQPERHRHSTSTTITAVRRSSSSITPVDETGRLVAGRRRTRQNHVSDMADLRDWMPIINQFDRVCGLTTNKSKSDVSRQRCIEEELRGALCHRCDEMHKFNIEQRTRHECHFLRERIHCKEALVSSACGAEAGQFAYSVVKLATEKQSTRHGCKITLENDYIAFRYGNGCPRDFLQQVDSCTSRHLTEKNVAKFHADNDLVALGTERNVRNTCRVYKRFEQCIGPVKTQCHQGFTQLLDYEGDLRRYILKMNHICDDKVIDVYAQSLTCYQRVMEAGTLAQCDSYWADLSPWLSNITSYQFYCEPTNTNTVNLLGELQKLHMCHSSVLTRGCGAEAAHVMSGLVHDALHDPLYLRLRHRADCALHRQPSESFEAPPTPTHHKFANGAADLRPTLKAFFPVEDTSAESVDTDAETKGKSASNERPMYETDEDLVSSESADVQPDGDGDSEHGTTARWQYEHNHDLDENGLLGAEDDTNDEETDGSLDGKTSMLNSARRRSSSSAVSIRQVSLTSIVFALFSTLLARGRWR